MTPKIHHRPVEPCALCGGWPMAIIAVGAAAESYLECLRCRHQSQHIAGSRDLEMTTTAAVEAWNLEMRKQ